MPTVLHLRDQNGKPYGTAANPVTITVGSPRLPGAQPLPNDGTRVTADFRIGGRAQAARPPSDEELNAAVDWIRDYQGFEYKGTPLHVCRAIVLGLLRQCPWIFAQVRTAIRDLQQLGER